MTYFVDSEGIEIGYVVHSLREAMSAKHKLVGMGGRKVTITVFNSDGLVARFTFGN